MSLYSNDRDSSESEKFLNEIIGELDGTYCAVEQFKQAVENFEDIVGEQFKDIAVCVAGIQMCLNSLYNSLRLRLQQSP